MTYNISGQAISKNNSETTAIKNRKIVLRLLRERGPLIRKEIAEITKLHRSTITYIINELLELKLIRYNETIDRKYKGKQLRYLELNPEWGYVVGVEADSKGIGIIATDLNSDELWSEYKKLKITKNTLVSSITDTVKAVMKRPELKSRRFLGLGIGFPGVVDVINNKVLNSVEFDIQGTELAQAISKVIDVPVFIDNNANAAALAEMEFGLLKKELHGIMLYMQEVKTNEMTHAGLAFGLIINRHVYHGHHFQAGELGDFLMPFEGKKVDVKTFNDLSSETMKQIVDHLAYLITIITDILDPRMIVVGGNVEINQDEFMSLLREQVNKKSLKLRTSKDIVIEYSQLGTKAVMLGSTMLIINRLFDVNAGQTSFWDDEEETQERAILTI